MDHNAGCAADLILNVQHLPSLVPPLHLDTPVCHVLAALLQLYLEQRHLHLHHWAWLQQLIAGLS